MSANGRTACDRCEFDCAEERLSEWMGYWICPDCQEEIG